MYADTLEGINKYIQDLGFDAHVVGVDVNVDSCAQEMEVMGNSLSTWVAGPQEVTVDVRLLLHRPVEHVELDIVVKKDDGKDATDRYDHAMSFLKDV